MFREISQAIAGDQNLSQNFSRRQIANQFLRAGVAKRTRQRTSDLTAEAQRAPTGFGNVNRFHFHAGRVVGASRKSQQPLSRTVAGNLFLNHLRSGQRKIFRQQFTMIFAEIQHLRKIVDSSNIEPIPQLRDSHRPLLFRYSNRRQRSEQLQPIQSNQRRQSI